MGIFEILAISVAGIGVMGSLFSLFISKYNFSLRKEIDIEKIHKRVEKEQEKRYTVIIKDVRLKYKKTGNTVSLKTLREIQQIFLRNSKKLKINKEFELKLLDEIEKDYQIGSKELIKELLNETMRYLYNRPSFKFNIIRKKFG